MANNILSIDTIKEIFLKNGGTEKAFNEQIGSLFGIVQLDIMKTLFEQKPPPAKLPGIDEATKYIQANFSEEEIAKTTESSIQKVVSNYLTSLSS